MGELVAAIELELPEATELALTLFCNCFLLSGRLSRLPRRCSLCPTSISTLLASMPLTPERAEVQGGAHSIHERQSLIRPRIRIYTATIEQSQVPLRTSVLQRK